MKKIMFNDRYLLTKAVLSGEKTQTRRIAIPNKYKGFKVVTIETMYVDNITMIFAIIDNGKELHRVPLIPKYQIGEVVAIAQSYYNAFGYVETGSKYYHLLKEPIVNGHKGNYNKMFVKAELMPHQIKIIDIRLERLQDISNEDCLKEGINACKLGFYGYDDNNGFARYNAITPKKAYSRLIEDISGKGIWESNPFVWAYDFELVK